MSREYMLGKWFALGLGFVFPPIPAVLCAALTSCFGFSALCLDRRCCPCLGLQPCLWVQNQHLTEQISGLWGGGAMPLPALGSLVHFWLSTCSVSYDLSGLTQLLRGLVRGCVWALLASADMVLQEVCCSLCKELLSLTSREFIFIFHQIPLHSHTTGVKSD